MSWASKANNQWQTVGDVSGAITAGTLRAIGSAPSGKSSSQYITYAEFIAWVQTSSGLASSARWVTKNAVNSYIVNLPYSFTVYSLDPHAMPQCYGSKADACTHSPAYSRTLYSSTSSISSGAILYFLISGVFVTVNYSTNGGANLWLYDATGGNPFIMTDDGGVTTGIVNAVDTCATPCYSYTEVNVTDISFDPYLYYLLCDGTPSAMGVTVGINIIADCIREGTIYGGAAFEGITYGTVCNL